MASTDFILGGIGRDCKTENAAIGVNKDLILIEYKYFDLKSTKSSLNRELDNTFGNYQGLTNIKLREGAVMHVFEGTDYSVVPTVTPEVKENGNTWYSHGISFTVYSKLARDRKILEVLGSSRVIAVTKDRSTGLYELFGMEQGLKVTGLDRSYVGSQNSNFYNVTIATPEVGVVKESTIGELSVKLNDLTEIAPTPIDSDALIFIEAEITRRFNELLPYTPENVANKNVSNGYAGLDEDGKINPLQLVAKTISLTTPTGVPGDGDEWITYEN